MAIALNGNKVEYLNGNELHSKVIFDNVGIQTKKMPESSRDSGRQKIDSVLESAITERDNPIIADTPNSYKDYGTIVENLGFFIIPRSVTSDPRYQGARLKYKHVLHIILEKLAFAETTHAIGTEIIPIAIGQFCVTERRLVDLCNEGVKFKEDLVDKNIVRRAVHFWRTCQYLNHKVIHDKTLLTITLPEFYERNKKVSEPESEPKVNQNRTSKEEDKELKQDNISSVADAPSEKKKGVSSSRKRKKVEPDPLVERDKGIFTSDIAHQKLIEEKGSEQIVKEIYSAMAVWKADKGIQAGDDFKTALRWSLTPKGRPRTYTKPVQPKYNHDTSPSLPSKSISFAEEV